MGGRYSTVRTKFQERHVLSTRTNYQAGVVSGAQSVARKQQVGSSVGLPAHAHRQPQCAQPRQHVAVHDHRERFDLAPRL